MNLTEYLTYDWWRDIWLPGAGAILIPLAIAFFTWWFGASRAEKNRDLRDLQENLNFLISIIFPFLKALSFFKEKFEEIQHNEVIVLKMIENNVDAPNLTFDDICRSILFENVMHDLDIKCYAICAQYDKDFVANITTLKSISSVLENMLDHRNNVIETISTCENIELRIQRCLSFIRGDSQDTKKFLNSIASIIQLIDIVYVATKNLELKIKQLNLIHLEYDDQMNKAIRWAKEYHQKLKNPSHT